MLGSRPSQATALGGDLVARDAAVVEITGGAIFGLVEAQDTAVIHLLGGSILDDLRVEDAALIRITGTGFNLPLGTVTSNAGILTGALSDGTPLDVAFFRTPNATIELIPEPGPLGAVLAAGIALGALRARRARRARRNSRAHRVSRGTD